MPTPDWKDIKCVLDIQAGIGECLEWSAEKEALYWVDIYKCTVNRFDPSTGINSAWPVPAEPGCFSLRKGNGAVIAMRDGIYDFDFGSNIARRHVVSPFDIAAHRFNDGRCDRQGRLWVGSVNINTLGLGAAPTEAFYRFDGKVLEPGISGVAVSNGCAFSPDGSTMYRAETAQRVIYAYDYDTVNGIASNERVFGLVPEDLGHPDGATVDTKGGYWSALINLADPKRSSIARFDPSGKLDALIFTPNLLPTMPAFGGATMSDLYFTTVSAIPIVRANAPSGGELSIHRQSGGIFQVLNKTGYQGVPETLFCGFDRADQLDNRS